MNNIDLNTITVAEAKAAGIAGIDLLTVLRNPVNSVTTKKNAEFAANLNEKTKKPARKAALKHRASSKATKRLGWTKLSADGINTNIVNFYKGMQDLLGKSFTFWTKDEEFKSACTMAVTEAFGESEVEELSSQRVMYKGRHHVDNLNTAIRYIKEDTVESRQKLNSHWGSYRYPIVGARDAGLIPTEEANALLSYMASVKAA